MVCPCRLSRCNSMPLLCSGDVATESLYLLSRRGWVYVGALYLYSVLL
jgi:hypothetical protein